MEGDLFMKKRIIYLMLILGLLLFTGCKVSYIETDCAAAIMVDGKIYLQTMGALPGEVDESAILGYFKSYTDDYPKEDGQTNISKDLINAPYAKVEGGIAILLQNEWYLCVPEETEPSVVNTYEVTDSDVAFENDEIVILVKHYEMSDGTWKTDNFTYQYRLEITGRMPNAVKDTTYVFLSNVEEILFQKAMMASGLSSNTEDYFDEETAKFVGIK